MACPTKELLDKLGGMERSPYNVHVQQISPPLGGISGQELLDKPSRVQKSISGQISGQLLDRLI